MRFKAISRRIQAVRDRAIQLFDKTLLLEETVPKDDIRTAALRALFNGYFETILVLYEIEDKIDDEIAKLKGARK